MKTQSLYILDNMSRGWTFFTDGKIRKPDGYLSDGDTWQFIGLCRKEPFGRMGPMISREDLEAEWTGMLKEVKENLRFKNGKLAYYIVDEDHNQFRILGGF